MDLNESHEEESGKMEPGELLEDGWFFGNSLHRKPRMLRSMSDPCTSSLPAKSFDETYASINKQVTQSHGPQPPNLPRKLGKSDKKMIMSLSSKGLPRAPSLPITLQEREDFHDDEEVEFSMGKLIRQASMKPSDRLPPRQHASIKVLARNASLTMYRSRRDSEGFDQETRPVIQRSLTNKPKARKNLTEFEYRELRGFNDLGFDLDHHERSPEDRNIIPPAPPVPKWGRGNGKKSSEDMKAQIKFWARAVASNVRQEC